MTKHRHYRLIEEKAKNLDLVIFVNDGKRCQETDFSSMVEHEDVDFFLCSQKHLDLVNCWIESGMPTLQIRGKKHPVWVDFNPDLSLGVGLDFMKEENEIRLKPRRQKRWVGVAVNGESTPNYGVKGRVEGWIKDMGIDPSLFQVIEFEMEI
ncbi:hypothetical protein CRN61_17805 [Vibrio vulnificus]|uniref:hypothetical protein n=1 Tax=Vibrio vulnificus TaxID=672 RepID=UPI000C9DC7A3|nr:hypothetical protein [Vibrio vulnificus]PNG65003.1 hypothetical protein SC81_07755 [Vibrio vulnificus]POC08136.1 hypothetical protein CRN54_16595 [Vibrio vulnificus]POC78047.1 hypothetical protein CRN61_17805 [Vibrio vulnificus]